MSVLLHAYLDRACVCEYWPVVSSGQGNDLRQVIANPQNEATKKGKKEKKGQKAPHHAKKESAGNTPSIYE